MANYEQYSNPYILKCIIRTTAEATHKPFLGINYILRIDFNSIYDYPVLKQRSNNKTLMVFN